MLLVGDDQRAPIVRRDVGRSPVSGTCDVVRRPARAAVRSEVGIGLPDRVGFQHHAVLVGLAENGRDLALAEAVVQRVLDRLHGTPSRIAASRSTVM